MILSTSSMKLKLQEIRIWPVFVSVDDAARGFAKLDARREDPVLRGLAARIWWWLVEPPDVLPDVEMPRMSAMTSSCDERD
jgi:hypothetical protein